MSGECRCRAECMQAKSAHLLQCRFGVVDLTRVGMPPFFLLQSENIQ